jgi:hypothetical protein
MPTSSPTQTLTADHVTYRVRTMPNEHTNIRLWAVHKQNPRTEADYQSACNMAQYWYYCNKLECVYNAAVQRKVDAIDLIDN